MQPSDSGFITSGDYRWHFEVFGNGENFMLGFHGFGRNCEDFKVLEPALGHRYKIISFDLICHGESSHPKASEESNFDEEGLKIFVLDVCKHFNIDRFSILAYSLGGKLGLKIIELFPEKIDRILLFAPDGVKISKLYQFAVKTMIGRAIFRIFIFVPQPFFAVLWLLKMTKIIRGTLFKFLHFQMESRVRRNHILNAWYFFRQIEPDLEKFTKEVNERKLSIHAFFGRHDAVIPVKFARRLAEKLDHPEAVQVVEMGHNLIKPAMNEVLREILQKEKQS